MSLSLYNIEASLLELVRLREDAELEGDSEALKVIDQQLTEYVQQREPAKIDSTASLIHQLNDEADACNRQAERYAQRAKQRRDLIMRILRNVLFVMQSFGVKELKTPLNTLRRQANGGIQALDCVPLEQMPIEFVTATVTIPLSTWKEIVERVTVAGHVAARVVTTPVALGYNTERIREALKQRVVCPECLKVDGPLGLIATGCTSLFPECVCQRCNGQGTISNEIPGVKLLPRGEHVRIL